MSLRDITEQENEILNTLGKAFTMLSDLPQAHGADLEEFSFHIHACQNIVLARPATEYIMQESALLQAALAEQAEQASQQAGEASDSHVVLHVVPHTYDALDIARAIQQSINEAFEGK